MGLNHASNCSPSKDGQFLGHQTIHGKHIWRRPLINRDMRTGLENLSPFSSLPARGWRLTSPPLYA
jgi:hypothetical protein